MTPVRQPLSSLTIRSKALPVIELIIFDCDGTLIESETLAAQIESELLSEVGLTLSPAQINRRFAGVSPHEMLETIETEHQITLPNDFFHRMGQKFFERAQDELKVTPNAPQVLNELRHPMCIASNSQAKWVEHNLKATGIFSFFEDRIYSSSLVARGKPAPDIFHFAADKHNAEASKCLVIEDSPSGVKAADAAGMPVLGYIGGGHCQHDHADLLRQAGADYIIEDLLEILGHEAFSNQGSGRISS